MCIFSVQIRQLLLTLEAIDSLCLVYSNLCWEQILPEVRKYYHNYMI